jgi:predicted amidohydrolase YtcJ
MQIFYLLLLCFLLATCSEKQNADIILHNGKVVTVDSSFSIAEAIAIKDEKIFALGTSKDILKLAGQSTQIIDLKRKTVVPGLIDAHAHPIRASRSEYREKIPDVHSINELLQWIHSQTQAKPKGEWIIHPKFFITRMQDMRQLTLRELDSVSPDHPVFLDGSFGGMVNTVALKISGLWDSSNPGLLRSKKTKQPLGLIQGSIFPLLAIKKTEKLNPDQEMNALTNMFQLYNQMGITSIYSGGGDSSELALYEKLMRTDKQSVRVFHNMIFPIKSPFTDSAIQNMLSRFNRKTGDGNTMVKVGAFKVVLDGGVLTGTAYLRKGWGEKAGPIYGINNPEYRGNILYSQHELERLISIAAKYGWKFTAHVTGGGAVDTLLAAYNEVNKSFNITGRRFSIIHGNFYTPEAIQKMVALGIYADMQPAWFLKDADLLHQVLDEEQFKTFHPYQSLLKQGVIINGGSDHMVKLDADESINPYNPFLAIWAMVSRKTERGSVYYPEEAVSREDALRMYTINNARGSFEENIKGSLEPGKFADMAVLSADLLACPVDSIKQIRSVLTILNGKIVYER